MTTSTQVALTGILDGLMRRYQQRVPDVSGIIQCMIDEGLIQDASDIQNDHIAFRTMGVDNLGIASLEKIFLHHGYSRRDPYNFASKKLNAYWYSPPEPSLPRIFISELRVNDLSDDVQKLICSYTDEVTSDPVDALDLDDVTAVDNFLHSGLWRLPTLADYETLATVSEYAAWVIYNRYYLNHFTVTIHNLPDGYNTIATFNDFLEARGFKFNDAGGKIKTSNDGKLIQSSTVAEMITATFAGGDSKEISGSYVEFAERLPLADFEDVATSKLTRDMRREGFEAANADKIFESTYSSQTQRT
jgi:hypothetical protein